ncbi:MAG: MBL fold metallo-hydrolase [Deltaproteobacteria bacterium]|nr:MBL fold metallo-hydrolase [Deltaproteobacteria bacterium]
MDKIKLEQVDKVEILTLQDNYIDLLDSGGSPVIARAMPVKDMRIGNSIVAEHGFSALVTVTSGSMSRIMLFDFGFSEWGVSHNMDALGVDPGTIEVCALSHGHMDHFGGMLSVAKKLEKGIPLVLHPVAFRQPRYIKLGEELKIYFPELDREKVKEAGFEILETTGPKALLDGRILFLGEVPRKTNFEKGLPYGFYEEDGKELWDAIEDDTAVVINLKTKGLVVLTGCAHSGVINTIHHAIEVTGVEKVHAVIGGFHLSGPQFEPAIQPTIDAMKEIGPDYVAPTHCTGRPATLAIENQMPSEFLLNMSGTKMTFVA